MILGLKQNQVRLAKHDPEWMKNFQKEKENLHKVLGDRVKIEHIGSTAISTIVAKPIIDILVGIKNLSNVKKLESTMKVVRYTFIKEHSTKDRLFFIKFVKNQDTHHLHIIKHNTLPWKRAVAFRDYLVKNKKVAMEYEDIKKRLARTFAHNRDMYSVKKQEYLQKLFKQILNIP